MGEAMRRVSHREYLGWVEHLCCEVLYPDRHDWYLMRLGQIVLSANGDKSATLEKVRLKPELPPLGRPEPVSPRVAAARTSAAKARWAAVMSANAVYTPPQEP